MADIIIYAAGNPDLYPIEYYDGDGEGYDGIIPQMLADFADESGYELSYYRAGEGDLREELGRNHQVDIISGCIEGENIGGFDDAEGYTRVQLFSSVEDGKTQVYEVYVTDAAPEGLAGELGGFAAEYSAEKQLGTAIATASGGNDNADVMPYMAAAGGLILILAVILSVLTVRYRRALKSHRKSMELDQATGMMTGEALKKWAEENIDGRNRILYYLIYFKIDLDYLQAPGRMERGKEFYRYAATVVKEYVSEGDVAGITAENGIILLCQSLSSDDILDRTLEVEMRLTSFFRRDSFIGRGVVTAGICPMGKFKGTIDESIRYSFHAAVSAGKSELPYVICDDSFIRKTEEVVSLRNEMLGAIRGDEMEIYLQFYVEASSLRILGGEALARWNHPERGMLGPAHFIPALEDEGLISVIDYYCLEKVCRFLDELADMGVNDFFISCNFSRKTFAAEDFVERWEAIVEKHSFQRDMLVFELTESIEPRYRKKMHDNLIETRNRGIHVFLDDFGEGFTSLYDLREYAVDGVKLDRTLTDYADTERGKSILSALIALGHEMGVKIIAEGVESMEQVEVLKELGCDITQGYVIHYPAPLWDIKRSLHESRSQAGR